MAITSRKVTRYRAVENCEDLSGEDELDLKQILFIYFYLGDQCLNYFEDNFTCLKTKQVCQKYQNEYQNGYCK